MTAKMGTSGELLGYAGESVRVQSLEWTVDRTAGLQPHGRAPPQSATAASDRERFHVDGTGYSQGRKRPGASTPG